MDPGMLEIFKTLGIAAPMVVLQFWLLKNCEAERQAITSGFLADLQLALSDNRKDMARMLDRQEEMVRQVMGIGTARALDKTAAPPMTMIPVPTLPATDWRNS